MDPQNFDRPDDVGNMTNEGLQGLAQQVSQATNNYMLMPPEVRAARIEKRTARQNSHLTAANGVSMHSSLSEIPILAAKAAATGAKELLSVGRDLYYNHTRVGRAHGAFNKGTNELAADLREFVNQGKTSSSYAPNPWLTEPTQVDPAVIQAAQYPVSPPSRGTVRPPRGGPGARMAVRGGSRALQAAVARRRGRSGAPSASADAGRSSEAW